MLGERIKQLRKEKHLTQIELSNLLHVSQQTIGAWETERITPGADTLNNIADFFNVSADYLLGRTKERSSLNNKESKQTIDLTDDDAIFTYEGRKIPKEDLEIIRRLMRGGKE